MNDANKAIVSEQTLTAKQAADKLGGKLLIGGCRTTAVSLWVSQQRQASRKIVVIDCVGDVAKPLLSDLTGSLTQNTAVFTPGRSQLPLNIFSSATSGEQQKQLAIRLLSLADYAAPQTAAQPELLLVQQLIHEHWNAEDPQASVVELIQRLASDDDITVGALSANTLLSSDQRENLAVRLNAMLLDGSLQKWADGPSLGEALNAGKRLSYISLHTLGQHDQLWALSSLLSALKLWLSADDGDLALAINLGSEQQLSAVTKQLQSFSQPLLSLANEHPTAGADTTEASRGVPLISADCESSPGGKSDLKDRRQLRLTAGLQQWLIDYAAADNSGPVSLAELQQFYKAEQTATDNAPVAEIRYLPVTLNADASDVHYRASLLVSAEFTYRLPRLRLRHQQREVLLAMLMPSGLQVDEQSVVSCNEWPENLTLSGDKKLGAMNEPAIAFDAAKLERSTRRLLAEYARQHKIAVYHCTELGLTSEPGETSEDFEQRLRTLAATRNEDRSTAIKARFEPKLQHLEMRIRKAEGQYRKALKKVNGGNTLLRSARFLTSKALSSQLNPGMHIPLRRAGRSNKLQSELTNCEQRLERLKHQKRELQNRYQQARDKQARQYKNEELEYRQFQMKTKASDGEVLNLSICGCPWGMVDVGTGRQKPHPLYVI